MKLPITIILILFHLQAHAFQADIEPSEISIGDAFVVKINSAETVAPQASLNGDALHFGKCGDGCFIAIGTAGLKTQPGVHTIKFELGGKTTELPLTVKHTAFPEIKLTLDAKRVFLSPEDLKRAGIEREKLTAIFQAASGKHWDGNFIVPLKNEFSTRFGVKRIINKEKISIHEGLDIRGKEGEIITASNSGKVVLAEELFFGGNTVVIDHGLGIYTVYMHLSGFKVALNDTVSKGDVIGLVGATGRASGPHLHFGVKVGGVSANPASIFNLKL